MGKIISLLICLSMMPIAFAYWSNDIAEVQLIEKDSSWNEIVDGDCNGLDYTGDSKVDNRDLTYVTRNKIDADGSGAYDRIVDRQFMKDNYQDCRAGKGTITFTAISKYGKTVQERARVSVWNLEPRTEYQLIYYGDETHNDVWNYATCIGKSRRTSTQGYFKGTSWTYDFSSFLNDNEPQKFWVVLASDVDCDAGEMTAWNPSEYLFEHATI